MKSSLRRVMTFLTLSLFKMHWHREKNKYCPMENCYMHCFTHLICASLLRFFARLFGVAMMAFNWNLLLQVHWLGREQREDEHAKMKWQSMMHSALHTITIIIAIASMKRYNQVASVENIDDAMFPYEIHTNCIDPVRQSEMIRMRKRKRTKSTMRTRKLKSNKRWNKVWTHKHIHTNMCTRK